MSTHERRLPRMRAMAGTFKCIMGLPVILLAELFTASHEVASPASPVCSLSADELTSRFLASAGTAPWPPGLPYMARWGKQELSIGVFQDRSARQPADSIQRNLAIFNAVGRLGLLFHFGVTFNSPSADIELIFVNKSTKQVVFHSLPIGSLISPDVSQCRVYAEVVDSDVPIRLITKSHILADDDTNVSDLPICIADALIQAIGLTRWPSSSSDDQSATDKYFEFGIFISALYAMPNIPDFPIVKKAVTDAKSLICR
jgi:hypothetical protein